MDYFQNQDVARKRTGLLVFLFITAVILIILSVYFAIGVVLEFAEPEVPGESVQGPSRLWDPELFGMVALGTSGLIAGGSLFKIAALSGGGHTVAELLGGRLLHPDKASPDERRLLNVVEEMAIASGLPVPPVYLLENESGINAFAAGHTTGDAVIAVTSGTLHRLSRDELQGVIAHEFSHILNGDMRLNIRLMGVLFGILVIGLTGWIIFRSSMGGGYVRVGARDDDRKGFNPLPLIGLALYVIGYVGVFFGNLIKAAVSRQREFLADASAVQFTRNPDGIAGALKKIGALAEGSHVQDSHAEEASHMFFGEAVSGLNELFGLLSTHPPLVERIRRIDPSFTGDFSQVRLDPIEEGRPGVERSSSRTAFGSDGADSRGGRRAGGDHRSGPHRLCRGPQGIDSRPAGAGRARSTGCAGDGLRSFARPGRLGSTNPARLAGCLRPARRGSRDPNVNGRCPAAGPQARLPLVEMAAPALCQMTPAQFHDFIRCVEALVQADNKLTLFEYALQRLLIRHVVTHFVRCAADSP